MSTLTIPRGEDVTVLLAVRNEMARIETTLDQIAGQTLPPARILAIDGLSDDGTRAWLEAATARYPTLVVVDNPDRTIPAAGNVGLGLVDTTYVARMDAHVDYPPDHLARLVSFLQERPGAIGAGSPFAVQGDGPWGNAFAAVLRRPWGHGGSAHQTAATPKVAAHVRWAVYRTAAVRQAGGWDAGFPVNEDAELDHRVRRHGELWLVPGGRPVWHTRHSPMALARQMWRYGWYRARTVCLHPDSLDARIMGPPLLVTVVVVLLGRSSRRSLAAAAWLGAGAACLGAASAAADGASPLRGAVTLPLVHLPYGAGMLVGLAAHRGAASSLPLAGTFGGGRRAAGSAGGPPKLSGGPTDHGRQGP